MLISRDKLPNAQLTNDQSFVPIGDGLEVFIPVGAKNGDCWEVTVEPYATPSHLASAVLSDQVFVSSKNEILSNLSGNTVFSNNNSDGVFTFPTKQDQAVQDFRTDKLVQFFNHLFLVKGRTLFWTDLDSYLTWYPDTNNEADFRELEGESSDATGLIRVNDVLYLHFPQAIYTVEYVGKPTIVRILNRSQGIGAINQRSIVVHQSIQYFLGLDNFYLFSPESGVKQIGQEIWKKFTRDCSNYDSIWSYLDIINNEVCWVYDNRILAFNYKEGHWSKYSSDSVLSHTTAPWLSGYQYIHSTETTGSTIDQVRLAGLQNFWVTSGSVCREAVAEDNLSDCFAIESPVLESDDFSFGDIFNVKTVDEITLDARYDGSYDGMRVFVSARDFVTDPVVWKDVGKWTQGSPLKKIDFPPIPGRVLKFKFEVVMQDLVSDGTVSFDGTHSSNGLFAEAGKVEDKALGYFEINAWGETVDAPQKIGPDK